jgi:HlyD family secretion protein
VRAAQPAKIKLAAFQFQKYGMLEGAVAQVSADATEGAFRALIDLAQEHLESDGRRYALAPGMQVLAEIHLGERTVLEYLLSPVRKAFHEAGRER